MERSQIEAAAYNRGIALSAFVREAALAMAGVEEAEERLRRAREELEEAREQPVLAPAVEVEAEPHRVTVYTGDEYLHRHRGAGGSMHDPARYEAA